MPMQQLLLGFGARDADFPEGDSLFMMPGTWDWICPPGVETISVVVIGAGGGRGSASPQDADGGGGGGLAYKNNISVTPGSTYTVTVGKGGSAGSGGGAGGSGGSSSFSGWGNTVTAGGGSGGSGSGGSGGSGGSPSGSYDGGGDGGRGGSYNPAQGGGGGAGGYGGNGGRGQSSYSSGPGYAGNGGAGGGGNQAAGGGVDLYGQGPSGAQSSYNRSTYIGFGGSYGADSTSNSSNDAMGCFGGGSGSTFAPHGAVRIIWAKKGETARTFPTSTGDVVTGSTLFIGGQKHNLSSTEASSWGTPQNWNGMITRSNMGGIQPSTQTGAFTYEVWIKPFKLNDNTATFSGSYGSAILGGRPHSSDGDEYGEWSLKAGTVKPYGSDEYPENFTMTYHDGGVDQLTVDNCIPADKWTHVVHTRDGSGNHKFYVNGVAQTLQNGSTSISWSGSDNNYSWPVSQERPIIGGWAYGSGHYVSSFHGLMSEMRVTNTQVYTSNFTPPTSRLTNISGTQWLILNNRYHPNFAEVGPGIYDRPDTNVGTQRGMQMNGYFFTKGSKVMTHINDHPYHPYEGDSGFFFGCMDYDASIQRSYGYVQNKLHDNSSNSPHWCPIMGKRHGTTKPVGSEDSPFNAGDEALKPGYWSAEFSDGYIDYSPAKSSYIQSSASNGIGIQGDFTLEMWVKTSTTAGDGGEDRRIFTWDGPTGNSSGNLQLKIDPSTGKLAMVLDGSSHVKSTTNIADGSWHHIAISRYRNASNNVKMFIDGTHENSQSFTTTVGNFNSGNPRFRIGAVNSSQGRFVGKISNVRLLRTGKYRSSFTVLTKPLCRKKPSS